MRNVVRVLKGEQAHFSIIANQPAKNRDISYKARGILWLCLTRPDNWSFNVQYLINMSGKDGRDSVRSGLAELQAAGYMFRRRIRDTETGKWAGGIWLVFEYPWQTLGYTEEQLMEISLEAYDATPEPHTGFPHTDKPHTDNPTADNRPLLKTDLVVKTDRTKDGEKLSANAPSLQPTMDGLIDPEQTTDFSNDLDAILQALLKDEAKRSGRTGPRKFQTYEQKLKWRAAADAIVETKGIDELHKALHYATGQGRNSRSSVINTVVKWAENITTPAQWIKGQSGNVMTNDEYTAWAIETGKIEDPAASSLE